MILKTRLRAAIDRLNPRIPAVAREAVFKKALCTQALTVIDTNEAFHRLLTEGVDVKFSIGDGKSHTDKVWVIDFDLQENNEFLAVNQFTVVESTGVSQYSPTNKRLKWQLLC